ncbi:PREDICTED: ribosome biogenesis protein WDR12 homolog [Trachymyrmex cornetzi]|uniref:ribosome biogenesis protein WDR12 homolog n=1 Tax=Trachymyrmex cornetzi TaxID=471704 RepID=UPI00084F0555|nr:PREDICTED: ribosome biogenesis protein WDR12 homolog [Trachymyrmex cornetzi]XP_018366845.1 PREDICTED: ribosome biogenesis protein WDR12 homolog [Trachymyrmex cornetzi]
MEIESVKKNRLKMKSKDKAMSTNKDHKDEIQIQIRFITKQQQFAVPDFPLSVHSSIITDELNTLINELLRESNDIQDQVEFDFLICSQFLRSSLIEHITDREISTEDVIDIEYVEKHPSPEPKDCLIHDDWVSAVAVCGKWILTGSYDNMLHIWTLKGKHHLVIPGHISPVRAVAWISLNDDNASFVSASMDQTCMIWNWDITKNSVECIHICKGHRRSIEAVSINYDKTLMATGAWDNMLYIWSTSTHEDDNDGESASKRARSEYANKTKTPKCAMKGHKQAISAIVWSDKTEIITGSWDHTIKTWDTELNGIKQEIYGDKCFFDIDYSPLSRVVIAGSADQHVRLYDPRSTEGTIVKARFTSHTQWVTSVRWSTIDEHLFISGAYDNIVKLWDTRSPKAPLFDLLGHEDKVLSCDWSNPKLIMSGGADNTLRIFKSNHVER